MIYLDMAALVKLIPRAAIAGRVVDDNYPVAKVPLRRFYRLQTRPQQIARVPIDNHNTQV